MSKRRTPPSPTHPFEADRHPEKMVKLESESTAVPLANATPPQFSMDADGNQQPTFSYDGAIVLLETSENPPSLFRASICILSRQSLVFREMLAPPQLETLKMLDGNPVVVVDDKPSDLQLFMNALHYSWNYFDGCEWKASDALGAILRLSTKYGVAHLRKRIINHLSKQYPGSLSKFDRSIRPDLSISFIHLNLARESNAIPILPVLFYFCATSTSASEICSAPSTSTAESALFFRNPQDKAICLTGREALISRALALANTIGNAAGTRKKTCRVARRSWMQEAIGNPNSLPRIPLEPGPISDIASRLSALGICGICEQEVNECVSQARADLWADLPQIFGLPDWKAPQYEA